jgi:hypothetical protein
LFANTQMMGFDMGFPDVCKTPTPAGPVPVTYPNGIYEVKNKAANSSPKNTTSSKATFNSDSNGSKSMGDEAGTLKGVVSSITMGKMVGNAPLLKYLVDKAHAKGYKVLINVKAEGKAVISLQGIPQHNDSDSSSSSNTTLRTRGAARTYMARSGTEGMEWLLRRLD